MNPKLPSFLGVGNLVNWGVGDSIKQIRAQKRFKRKSTKMIDLRTDFWRKK